MAPGSVVSALGLGRPFQTVASVAGIHHAGANGGVFHLSFPIQKPKWSFTTDL